MRQAWGGGEVLLMPLPHAPHGLNGGLQSEEVSVLLQGYCVGWWVAGWPHYGWVGYLGSWTLLQCDGPSAGDLDILLCSELYQHLWEFGLWLVWVSVSLCAPGALSGRWGVLEGFLSLVPP